MANAGGDAAVRQALADVEADRFPQVVRALRNPNFRLFWSGNFYRTSAPGCRMWRRAGWCLYSVGIPLSGWVWWDLWGRFHFCSSHFLAE